MTHDDLSGLLLSLPGCRRAFGEVVCQIRIKQLDYKDITLDSMVVVGASAGWEEMVVSGADPIAKPKPPKPPPPDKHDFLSIFESSEEEGQPRAASKAKRARLGSGPAFPGGGSGGGGGGGGVVDGAPPSVCLEQKPPLEQGPQAGRFASLCEQLGLSASAFASPLASVFLCDEQDQAAGDGERAEASGPSVSWMHVVLNDVMDDELRGLAEETEAMEATAAEEVAAAVEDAVVFEAGGESTAVAAASASSAAADPIPTPSPAEAAAGERVKYGLREIGSGRYFFDPSEGGSASSGSSAAIALKAAGAMHLIGGEHYKATCKQHKKCACMVTCRGLVSHSAVHDALLRWLGTICTEEEHFDLGVKCKESFGMKPRKRTKT